MVKACKGYLTEEGLNRVWDQERVMTINRIHDCLNLNRAYQDAFQRTKKRMEETPGEKPFDFSQLYIFGKFEAFCRRLEKVFTPSKLRCRFPLAVLLKRNIAVITCVALFGSDDIGIC